MLKSIIISALIMALSPTSLLAQDFDTGLAAYEANDYASALEQWRPLADQGNVDAQFYLALLYKHGRGVEPNAAEAVKWWRKAAEQQDSYSQHNLAVSYQSGAGIEQDIEMAIKWFRRAAQQNNANSMYNLGQIYLHGGPIEAAEATHWFRTAAGLGHTFSQHNLGGMYLFGNGVPQNYILAHMWFEIAFVNGDNKGISSLENVERQMSVPDITEARRLVWVCMGSNYLDCG